MHVHSVVPLGINHVYLFHPFFGVICPNRENFIHLDRDFIITGEELQILICTLQAWPLSIEGSLMCCTFCDMGHLFIKTTSEDQ